MTMSNTVTFCTLENFFIINLTFAAENGILTR